MQIRPPNKIELTSTLVLSLKLEEVSAKVRAGPPSDDAEDLHLPIWAGEQTLKIHLPCKSSMSCRMPSGIWIMHSHAASTCTDLAAKRACYTYAIMNAERRVDVHPHQSSAASCL